MSDRQYTLALTGYLLLGILLAVFKPSARAEGDASRVDATDNARGEEPAS